MSKNNLSRRDFMKKAGIVAGAAAVSLPAAAMAESTSSGSLLGSLFSSKGSGAEAAVETPVEAEAAAPSSGSFEVELGGTSSAQEDIQESVVTSVYQNALIAHLDEQGILYSITDSGAIRIAYTATNREGFSTYVRFDGDNPVVSITSWDMGNVGTDETNYIEALKACNACNAQYRWTKFYIDDEYDIGVRIDSFVDEASCGAMVLEYVQRLVSIMDEACLTLQNYVVA